MYVLAAMADLFGNKYVAEMAGLNQACAGVSFLIANILTGKVYI